MNAVRRPCLAIVVLLSSLVVPAMAQTIDFRLRTAPLAGTPDVCPGSVNGINCVNGNAAAPSAPLSVINTAADCGRTTGCQDVLNPPDPEITQQDLPAGSPPGQPISPADGPARTCFSTTIESPLPFFGRAKEVFRVADGSWWQIEGAYEYLNTVRPKVLLCPDRQRIQVAGKTLPVRLLAPASSVLVGSASTLADVVSSRIMGDFTGWSGNTNFRLANGETWMQSGAGYNTTRLSAPLVVIFRSGPVYEMQVDGVSERIVVTRVQ